MQLFWCATWINWVNLKGILGKTPIVACMVDKPQKDKQNKNQRLLFACLLENLDKVSKFKSSSWKSWQKVKGIKLHKCEISSEKILDIILLILHFDWEILFFSYRHGSWALLDFWHRSRWRGEILLDGNRKTSYLSKLERWRTK